jgi:hypothetical protein
MRGSSTKRSKKVSIHGNAGRRAASTRAKSSGGGFALRSIVGRSMAQFDLGTL